MKNKTLFVFGIFLIVLVSLSFAAHAFPSLPDSDGDGVPDIVDQCPTIPGPASNNGCPYTPTAVIAASPQSGNAPLTVSFSGTGSTDQGGTIVSYSWSFGDGTTGTGATVSHTYQNAGTYTATLNVADNQVPSQTNSATTTITVTSSVPKAIVSAMPQTGNAPLTVSFSGAGSSDVGGSITSYSWNFGDGTTGTGATVSHTYTAAKTYTATLTVTDNFGKTASATATIVVSQPADQPPVANFYTNPISGGYAPQNVYFTSTSTDPDGTITSTSWNFGDGATATGTTAWHTYSTAGTYTITLTVTDNGGLASTKQGTMTVLESPPVAIISATPTTGNAPLAVSFSGTTSYDPDGSITSYSWNFGDGTTGTGATVSHTYTAAKTYTATLTVTDNSGATSTNQVTIAVSQTTQNQPPVAIINANPGAGYAPLAVQFNSASYDPDGGSIISTSWNFGDNTTASGTSVSHTYATPGIYTAALTVTDSDGGASGSAQTTITVFPANNQTNNTNLTLPAVSIVGPQNTTYNYSNILVNISSANAANVTYSIDGGAEQSYVGAFFNVFADGWHTIVAFARNIFGMSTDSRTFLVNMSGVVNDTTAPTIVLINPADEATATSNNVAFVFNATDDTGVSDCSLILDGVNVMTVSANNGQNQIAFSLSNGDYDWQISCADQFGNTAYSEQRVLNVSVPSQQQTQEQPETFDSLYVGRISYDDTPNAGSDETFTISVTNQGTDDLLGVNAVVNIQDLGIRVSSPNFDLTVGETKTVSATISLPDDASGQYDVRLTIGNHEVNRVKYRVISVNS